MRKLLVLVWKCFLAVTGTLFWIESAFGTPDWLHARFHELASAPADTILRIMLAVFGLFLFLLVIGPKRVMAWFHVPLTLQMWNLIPVIALLAAWSLSVSLVLAVVQVRFRDIGVALPVLLQLWMFGSPIIYPLSALPESWRTWYLLNPMAGIVSSCRDILLRGVAPDPVPLRFAMIVTVIALPIAYLFFKRAEATMADLI